MAGVVMFGFRTVNVPGRDCPGAIRETNASYARPWYVPGVQTVGVTEMPSSLWAIRVARSAFAKPAPCEKTS